MVSPEMAPKKKPHLPEGATAYDVLNNFSGKQKAALAEEAGMTPEAYELFLEQRVREERTASTVASVETTRLANREVNPHDERAEKAVLKGLEELVKKITVPPLSEAQEERFFNDAYRYLNEAYRQKTDRENEMYREWALKSFTHVVQARAVRQLLELVRGGMPFAKAQKQVSDRFAHGAERQNVKELSLAYAAVSTSIYFDSYRQEIYEELNPLLQHYENNEMTNEDHRLLESLIQCAKAAYFKGKLTEEMLTRFNLLKYKPEMARVIAAYAKHGPHQKAFENVAGPTEVYGSSQITKTVRSGKGPAVSGYSRKSQRRPHRGTPDDERF